MYHSHSQWKPLVYSYDIAHVTLDSRHIIPLKPDVSGHPQPSSPVASDVAGSFILPGPRALSQRSKSIGEEFGASDYCVAPVHWLKNQIASWIAGRCGCRHIVIPPTIVITVKLLVPWYGTLALISKFYHKNIISWVIGKSPNNLTHGWAVSLIK